MISFSKLSSMALAGLILACASAASAEDPIGTPAATSSAQEAEADAAPKDAKAKSLSAWTKKNQVKFESADKRFSLRLTLLGQFLFTATDPDQGDSRNSFRTRRVRPSLKGTLFGNVDYGVQYELAGSNARLLDFFLDYGEGLGNLRVGQAKAPFGRQELTSIAKQQFVDRSITSKRFAPSRDQGLMAFGKNSMFEYGVGIYNGNGINQSRDDNDDKLVAGRVVFTPLGSYALDEVPFDYPDSPKVAFGVGAMTTTEDTGSAAVDITRFGGEFAFKYMGFNFISEYYTEEAEAVGNLKADTNGLYAQAGYLFPNKRTQIAVRYATIEPDVFGPSQDQTETGAAVSVFFAKHAHQLQFDYRQVEFDGDPTKDSNEFRAQAQITF